MEWVPAATCAPPLPPPLLTTRIDDRETRPSVTFVSDVVRPSLKYHHRARSTASSYTCQIVINSSPSFTCYSPIPPKRRKNETKSISSRIVRLPFPRRVSPLSSGPHDCRHPPAHLGTCSTGGGWLITFNLYTNTSSCLPPPSSFFLATLTALTAASATLVVRPSF